MPEHLEHLVDRPLTLEGLNERLSKMERDFHHLRKHLQPDPSKVREATGEAT
jgi:hypothetical protein